MQLYRPTRHYETVCYCLLGYVSVVFLIYCAIALLKFSSLSYRQRLSEAQLRLAPNRPCMTLVYYSTCTYIYVGTKGREGGRGPGKVIL